MLKTLAVDFDGVLHKYDSLWVNEVTIPDEPVPGAIDWLLNVSIKPVEFDWEEVTLSDGDHFKVVIFSSRCKTAAGIIAMQKWLHKHGVPERYFIDETISFSYTKPPAFLTIDDRAYCFRGLFPSVKAMKKFSPWNKK